MNKNTEDKFGDSEEVYVEELMDKLSEEAFLDARIMLEQLTRLENQNKKDLHTSTFTHETVIFDKSDEKLISHTELIRMVDVQAETIMRYLREGKLLPDYVKEDSKPYFTIASTKAYAEKYGWNLILNERLNAVFYDVLSGKRMCYSYKPVLIKAMLEYASPSDGECSMDDIITYFRAFYADRRSKNLFVEKERSVFARKEYTDQEARKVILHYPYKRFADMQLMHYERRRQIIGFHPYLWKGFTDEEKIRIISVCDNNLQQYYAKF